MGKPDVFGEGDVEGGTGAGCVEPVEGDAGSGRGWASILKKVAGGGVLHISNSNRRIGREDLPIYAMLRYAYSVNETQSIPASCNLH